VHATAFTERSWQPDQRRAAPPETIAGVHRHTRRTARRLRRSAGRPPVRRLVTGPSPV